MRKLLAGLTFALAASVSPALAQNFTMPPPAGVTVGGYVVVSSCGSQSLTAGKPAYATIDTTGKLCDSGGGGGSVTANQGTAAAITGGWPVIDGAGTDTSGNLTTGAGSVIASIDGYASAKIQVKGTYAAFTATVNASSDGGTTLVPIQCAMVDGSQFGSTFTLGANASIEISCGHQSGDDTLVLSTAAGPASGTAAVTISPSSFPSEDGSTIGIAPSRRTTTQAKTTIAVTNTYIQALAASTTRMGCTIQYIAVVGTKGFVFFGASPADTTTSFQLTNGQSINCALGGTGVATDAVQVTATGTDIFIVSNQ